MPHSETTQPLTNPRLEISREVSEIVSLRQEIRMLRFLSELQNALQQTRDADTALRFVLRASMEYFKASEATLAVSEPPFQSARVLFSLPRSPGPANLNLFAQLIRGEKPGMPGTLMYARLKRRERNWGVLALRSNTVEFTKAERAALARVGAVVTQLLFQIDLSRVRELRDRIDRKIMDQLRPIDLAYQILDALRSLTRYDHSSATLMADGEWLEVVAEQVAWKKARSKRIGTRLGLSPDITRLLTDDIVYGFTRTPGGWQEWEGRPVHGLAELLDFDHGLPSEAGECAESDLIVAPLRGRDGILGVLKVAACHPGTFGRHEADLIAAFLPQAAIAVQNAQRTESLHTKMIAAERKHAMADLARGVSHDLNNALGAVLPLVQQIRCDANEGTLDHNLLGEDLAQIEQSLQVCRRIFGGMLSFARRAAGTLGRGQISHAIDNTLSILEDGMRRRRISVEMKLPDELPEVRGTQSDLEQLLLNLLTNARDAMPDGGRVTVMAEVDGAHLRLIVTDTGVGISPEHLPLVQEPFFTTKSNGSGLGLSICRSIVWEMRGQIAIESRPGEGTRVVLMLPGCET